MYEGLGAEFRTTECDIFISLAQMSLYKRGISTCPTVCVDLCLVSQYFQELLVELAAASTWGHGKLLQSFQGIPRKMSIDNVATQNVQKYIIVGTCGHRIKPQYLMR